MKNYKVYLYHGSIKTLTEVIWLHQMTGINSKSSVTTAQSIGVTTNLGYMLLKNPGYVNKFLAILFWLLTSWKRLKLKLVSLFKLKYIT